MKQALSILSVAVVAVLIWQGVIFTLNMPPFLLPAPVAVVKSFWLNRAEIGNAALYTGIEVLLGFSIGATLGAGLAILMASSRKVGEILHPLLTFSQTIPVFALAPILTLWFGYDILPKVVMTVLIVFFPVASAFLDGLVRTPPSALDLAHVMNATPGRRMWFLRVPAAVPQLATGMRLAAVYAPIGAVIGEWVGGAKGLGALMIHANGRMKTDLVFAALLALSLMTVLFARLVSVTLRRLLGRYGA